MPTDKANQILIFRYTVNAHFSSMLAASLSFDGVMQNLIFRLRVPRSIFQHNINVSIHGHKAQSSVYCQASMFRYMDTRRNLQYTVSSVSTQQFIFQYSVHTVSSVSTQQFIFQYSVQLDYDLSAQFQHSNSSFNTVCSFTTTFHQK